MDLRSYPRLIIAGLGGDSGKTFVSCGIIRYFRDAGLHVGAFKKGPDYIDPAWLSVASGSLCRNLDAYLMPDNVLKKSFLYNAFRNDINIIEANRGLFDGFDQLGSYSSAELAKLLKIPVILIVPVAKMTRTASALVLGCKNLDPKLNIAGVIINQVAGKRQEKLIREAIYNDTGINVLGAIPKINNSAIIPARHLGLITPGEFDAPEKLIQSAKDACSKFVDNNRLFEIARSADKLEYQNDFKKNTAIKEKVRIGYFKDKIFSFYYPENLEALESAGAKLIQVSSFENNSLSDLDALYIGGGFPESNIDLLMKNRIMMDSVKNAADNGLPVYAECGGLIYLGDSITINGKEYKLTGALPLKFKMNKKPAGHGYMIAKIDQENPFYEKGMIIKGHEFHYSEIIDNPENIKTCMDAKRGVGAFMKRDGFVYKNVFACYIHIHSLGCPEWKNSMIKVALNYKYSGR